MPSTARERDSGNSGNHGSGANGGGGNGSGGNKKRGAAAGFLEHH